MTQYIITALGSYGDVHPMVGLGAALAERGHRVKLVTNPYFEDVVTAAGLVLLPISTAEQYAKLSQHPQIWHPIRGPQLVMKWISGYLLRPLYEIVTAHYVPGETVLCAHPLDWASRVAGEKLRAPVASIDNTPAVLWSQYDSPRLAGMPLAGPRTPTWLKRWQYWTADAVFVRWLLGRPLASLRRELGLPPVRRIFSRWLHQTDLVLGLFPDWFAPPQPDWPANMRQVGFPLWDSARGAMLANEVRAFLAAGDRPIAFTPGSAHHAAHKFFAAAVEACERLGRRGILLTKYGHQLPAKLPDSVRHVDFVPLSKLLPHTAALVHHGGIGTCAQALAAGVPQLVQPMAFDQFDNARRLVGLGVAEELPVRKFRGPAIAAALVRLWQSSAVEARCRELAGRCDGAAARSAACNALERLAQSHAAR